MKTKFSVFECRRQTNVQIQIQAPPNATRDEILLQRKSSLLTEYGKWMDGWETRRKRIPGRDEATFKTEQTESGEYIILLTCRIDLSSATQWHKGGGVKRLGLGS